MACAPIEARIVYTNFMKHLVRTPIKPLKRDLVHVFLAGRVKRVWGGYKTEALDALQSCSGLSFISGATIKVGYIEKDWEGSSGYTDRKSITALFPKTGMVNFDGLVLWLIMHELGHRLLEQHGIANSLKDMESEIWHEREHMLLFLFLIDAITELGECGNQIL